MMTGTDRFRAAAAARGLAVTVRRYDATGTAADAADAIGCRLGQIVKSLVFTADGAPILALVCGDDTVDRTRLATAAHATSVRNPGAEEAQRATGYPVGGVAPLGGDLPVYADAALLDQTEVWAAAGEPGAVFSVSPAALVHATRATVASLRADRSSPSVAPLMGA